MRSTTLVVADRLRKGNRATTQIFLVLFCRYFFGWHSTHWNIEMSPRLIGWLKRFVCLVTSFALAIRQPAEIDRMLNRNLRRNC